MIQTPTAFIVGAGASAGYGFPLGPGLVRNLIRDIKAGAVGRELLKAGFKSDDMNEFCDKLKGSDSDSIDTFLEDNQAEFVRIGTTAIALLILRIERMCKDFSLHLSNPEPNPLPNASEHAASHWLAHVWNVMRPKTNKGNLGENRVSFLVYNYDRTIEHYFETVIAASFNIPRDEAVRIRKEALSIVHIHGAIPEDQAFGAYHDDMSGERITSLGEGIRVIHDKRVADDPVFEKARKWLGEAKAICFLGFGYHETNIERLWIRRMSDGAASFYGSRYRMGDARRDVAQGLMNKHMVWGRADAMSAQFLSESVPLR